MYNIKNIDNSIPDKNIENNLAALITNLLDPLREAYGGPINVNSGYRCPELNAALSNSSHKSQHMSGQAADLSVGGQKANKALFDLIKDNNFDFDQLLDEANYSWIHVSYSTSSNRKDVKHLSGN